jgi:hypothetical protein
MQVNKILIFPIILLIAAVGCAPASPQPAEPPAEQPTELPTEQSTVSPAPALPSGWETYTDLGQCGYAIDHPSDMEGASQGMYSWSLSVSATEPSGPVPNFIFISVIPDGFQNEPGAIYNYDPVDTETLLRMQVGESKSLRENLNIVEGFTYTRLPDVTLSSQTAQAYENTQPWEFPPGTKEIRYYLKAKGCTYLIGGYLATVGSDQPGGIDEELFDQIIATFRLEPG